MIEKINIDIILIIWYKTYMENLMKKFFEKTELLDFDHKSIVSLIENKQWKKLNEKEKIKQIYNFVRDDIPFGYNIDDAISASTVLQDGYGQCNTKGILFMAILRAVNIPCRIHGFTIDKILQKGAIKGFYYAFSPKEIIHSWVEIYYKLTLCKSMILNAFA